MNDRRGTLVLFFGLLLLVALLYGLTWANLQFVSQDRGMNDFLPRWAGTRWLMVEGWSPYSSKTTEGIQDLVYGRPARADEEQGYFLQPFYAVAVYAPFALVGDPLMARALWMTALQVSLVVIVGGSLSLARWRLPGWALLLIVVFTIAWYHTIIAMLDSSILILCSLFLVLTFLAIRADQDALAGFLLAIATVRPFAMVLIIAYVMLWAISRRRYIIVWSFLGSIFLMLAAATLFIPDWVMEYLRQAYFYYTNSIGSTPHTIISHWLPGVGRQLGWAFTIGIAGMLVWEWRAAWGKDIRWFLWTAYLTIAAANLIGIRTSLSNYILLLPAIILVLATWYLRWGSIGRLLIVFGVLVLIIGTWGLTVYGVRNDIPPRWDPWLFFFTPILLILGLYWVRWWAINPPALPYVASLGRYLRRG